MHVTLALNNSVLIQLFQLTLSYKGFKPTPRLRASSPFREYREKKTSERKGGGPSRLASLAQIGELART